MPCIQYRSGLKMKMIKAIIALTGFVLLVNSPSLFACHESHFDGDDLSVGTSFFGGHSADRKRGRTFSIIENISESVTTTFYFTGDTFATTTNCKWRTSNIEKFFNNNYQQIAEESAQGQGPHLEALASQVGCNAQQTVLLERAMQQTYHDVFAKEDPNHSIRVFYKVVNSDEELVACWPKS